MKKKIPTKNYVILCIAVVLTIMFTFYARNWYLAVRDYNAANSPILSVVNEINVNEISNYTYESPKFVLYVSSGTNENIKYFERNFKNHIRDKGLEDSIIYINVDKNGKEAINNELKKYASDDNIDRIDVNDNVSMYIFENGQITKVVVNANNMNIEQIDSLFKKYKVTD